MKLLKKTNLYDISRCIGNVSADREHSPILWSLPELTAWAVLKDLMYNMVIFEKQDISLEKSSNLISCAYILASNGLHLQIIDFSCSINGTLMVRFRFGEPFCNETLSLRVLAARFAKPLL